MNDTHNRAAGPPQTQRILNRLLAIEYYSLANYLRYAPQLSTTGAVRDELVARSRQLLRRLR